MNGRREGVGITVVDSATHLDESCRGGVVVAASQGSAGPAYTIARLGALAVILNDTSVGKDEAGISALPYCEAIGMAAATIDYRSARISDVEDMMHRGAISFVNTQAARCGCGPGQSCAEAAEMLTHAARPTGLPPETAAPTRNLIAVSGGIRVWGIDTTGLIVPEDEGHIILTGSHGGLVGGDPNSATRGVRVRAAVFHDAGICPDNSSTSRLPALDGQGIPAATVGAKTARISHAMSVYGDGILSVVNDAAKGLGAVVGMRAREFVERVLAA